ncbi:tubby-like F-box protein 5 [Ipomoea triloba]|uniref:tubby-like F-box protein 5 n=1 Tax=Ipomoea triloba TaxID=35885 RepID=UPI00125D2628|nr:tubby-like F-box protein 5 [Ipomoea triloba]
MITIMLIKSITREMKDVKGGKRRIGQEGRQLQGRSCNHIPWPDPLPIDSAGQGNWEYLPPELLLDIIQRVEKSETSWPGRSAVLACASVCKSWREITKEIVKTPEECGRITFPISLKQPGPREFPIQCFIKRDRSTSTYRLYLGLTPSKDESDKLLLAAKRIRRLTGTDFMISLVADDFSRSSNTYVGKLRSNFLGTKFTLYDSQSPYHSGAQHNNQRRKRFNANKVSPGSSTCVSTIAYKLKILRTKGPRRMHCVMHSIPLSSIQEGGTAPTPTSLPLSFGSKYTPPPVSKVNEPVTDFNSPSLLGSQVSPPSPPSQVPLTLRNKVPKWHEDLQCWYLNFKGRVTVASVKNFQLIAAVDPSHNIAHTDQEKVILQFGKIGKDVFTMDYCFPLSAFQAFAICLTSFDLKPACE